MREVRARYDAELAGPREIFRRRRAAGEVRLLGEQVVQFAQAVLCSYAEHREKGMRPTTHTPAARDRPNSGGT